MQSVPIKCFSLNNVFVCEAGKNLGKKIFMLKMGGEKFDIAFTLVGYGLTKCLLML